jgi:hypothetical protein
LALAATTDREIVAQLTHTNNQLTTTIKTLTEQLQKLLAINANLVNKLGTTIPTTPSITSANGRKPFNRTHTKHQPTILQSCISNTKHTITHQLSTCDRFQPHQNHLAPSHPKRVLPIMAWLS